MSGENAKLTLEGGEVVLRVNAAAVFERLSVEELSSLAQTLTFRDEVFGAVADRLIDGHTKDHYWQGEREDDIHEKHRLRLLERLPDVERRAVKLLIQQRERLREEAKALAAWAWRTYHGMSRREDGYLDSPGSNHRVQPPEWYRRVADMTEAEVTALYDDAKSASSARPA